MTLPQPRALVGILAFALATPAAAEDSPAPPDTTFEVPRYIFAAEDTLKLPALFSGSEIEVTADRLKIGDIVQRCIEREKENRERIESWAHTQIVKSVLHVGGYGDEAERRIIREQADRVYYRRPDIDEAIRLKFEEYVVEDGERRPRSEESGPEMHIGFGDLDDLPFYLEDAKGYAFDILSRRIVGNRVVYEVRLTPKSDFEIAPGGRIWIDTSNFQIVREEFDFGDRVPVGWIIKSLGPMVRERERIGDVWVWKRWIVRLEVRDRVLRTMARLAFQKTDEIPHTMELVILFQDHLVNEPWPVGPGVPVPAAADTQPDGIEGVGE